ncbi:haloacid dehalogenase [Tepiditoga spiralis]|uniref:Haloacid dehalogenase n=1 Tax=Tepiditoga spiralis TaxID=2108365 RepID=A0A7G1GA47_9BACT|nr:HAD family hydrolase [Tepiditoga spiralis]BBE30269.1 haloacid dehalogenase [Tepiditoga spiralis]
MKNIKNIIFDIDGTLVNTKKVTIPAFKKTLESLDKDGFKVKVNSNEIMKYIGYTIDNIFKNIFKSDDKVLIEKAIHYLDIYEEEFLSKTNEIFFDGVFDVLSYLKSKNKNIYLLSNCNKKYLNIVLEKGLNEFIDSPHCSEMYNWKEKDYVISTFIKKTNSKSFVMIGDRHKDIEAAKANNIKSIGCNYGYGNKEVEKADVIIHNIKDIINIF